MPIFVDILQTLFLLFEDVLLVGELLLEVGLALLDYGAVFGLRVDTGGTCSWD
jgi:hypothetical protein